VTGIEFLFLILACLSIYLSIFGIMIRQHDWIEDRVNSFRMSIERRGGYANIDD